MVSKMEGSGLPGPRNSGLARALGGRTSLREDVGGRLTSSHRKGRVPGWGRNYLGGVAEV